MISKNQAKLIRSLDTKKARHKSGLFAAEGPKIVGDLIEEGFDLVEKFEGDEVAKVSFLQHPQNVLALFRIPDRDADAQGWIPDSELALALDGVQDPGNLGTIIRVADWFGIRHIYCSMQTADCWSPKVVQATMGSIARVRLHYTDLVRLADSLADDYPIYGTLLDGNDIYDSTLTPNGLIVMGNEGNGLTPEMRKRVNRRLLIPNYPAGRATADSLNVAIATAITCSEFRRRKYGTNL